MVIAMKKNNKQVENTKEQIFNTLLTLDSCGLARITKNVSCSQNNQISILTWDNHVSGRHNAGNAFTTLNQYVSIYETGAYHCILHDGSIIRVYFKFNKNILLQQSLLYWPAPITIPEVDIDELGIRDAMDIYIASQNSSTVQLKMRSPIRLDFDPINEKPNHPPTHMHMQHAECRISVKNPCCFNTFIKFIFLHFYPEIGLNIFHELEPLHYSGFESHKNAIISF